MPAQTVIKIRRDTSTNWDAVNPTLGAGEIAFETDTNKIKVGDGSTVWASLDYASGAGTAAEISYDNVDAELIATTVKGALDELSLTKADVSQLSTNLAVFATTAASDISGYNVLVSSIDNPDYNTTAVDVATGAVNADGQLISSLAASAGLFEGQVDPITVTTIGNIRKTAGNANQSASFYFEVYVRNAAGTETLVGTSDDTGEINPTNLNEYQEFSASAFVSFGTVLDTDRIVIKYYGNVVDGAGAEYDFQFGGGNPVRTLLPVPATVAVAHVASSVEVDTTNFNGTLSGSDTTVQAALETLDDLDISAGVITSDSPPSSPSNGDLWWESDTGILYIYYDNFWVEAVTGLDSGTEGFTALSNGTAGLSYQPVSHNYIINGAFDFWQRGDGPFTSSEYTADRWKDESSAATRSITKETFTPNDIEAIGYGEGEYYLRHVRTGGNFARLHNKIEDVRTLAGQTVTLSFWARVGSGTVTNTIRLNQEFGSGGSSSVSGPFPDITLTTDWQRFVQTITLDSVAGKTIGSNSHLDLQLIRQIDTTGHTIDIWGVQLEAGSIATPFKRNANSIQGEKAACKRYYQRTVGRPITNLTYYTGGQAYGVLRYDEMRRVPDFDTSGDTNFTILSSNSTRTTASVSASFIELDSLQLLATSTSATQGDGAWLRANSSSHFIELDAEL